MLRFISNILVIGILILLQACGGMPDKSQLLEQARATYAKAEATSTSEQKYTLAEAKIALTQAEQSQNEHDRQAFARLAIAKSKLAMDNTQSSSSQPKSKPSLRTKQPPSVTVTSHQTAQGMTFILPSTALFAENQADLEQIPAIQQIAQFLHKHPHQQALIEGHTQQRGHHDFNQGLSYRQANAVRFALMRQGIESNRIIVKGLGATRPMARDYSAQNQRVQVTISQPLNNDVARTW